MQLLGRGLYQFRPPAFGIRSKLAGKNEGAFQLISCKRNSATKAPDMMARPSDGTTRFSSRVNDYIASRPSYPPEVVSLLSSYFNLGPGSRIVDIGSGTGISSALLLEHLQSPEIEVVGIEPNKDMRNAGNEQLASYIREGRFSSVDGTAEQTGLEENSVDLIIAAQAFHWFDGAKARAECRRILKKSGNSGVALLWNAQRGVDKKAEDVDFSKLDNPVMSAYDLLLVRRAKDYTKVSHHKTVDETALKRFFGPDGFHIASWENPYLLDFRQLQGRLRSSSYTPLPGEEGYDKMMQELQEIFEKYQENGKIHFVYDTRVFYGSLS